MNELQFLTKVNEIKNIQKRNDRELKKQYFLKMEKALKFTDFLSN